MVWACSHFAFQIELRSCLNTMWSWRILRVCLGRGKNVPKRAHRDFSPGFPKTTGKWGEKHHSKVYIGDSVVLHSVAQISPLLPHQGDLKSFISANNSGMAHLYSITNWSGHTTDWCEILHEENDRSSITMQRTGSQRLWAASSNLSVLWDTYGVAHAHTHTHTRVLLQSQDLVWWKLCYRTVLHDIWTKNQAFVAKFCPKHLSTAAGYIRLQKFICRWTTGRYKETTRTKRVQGLRGDLTKNIGSKCSTPTNNKVFHLTTKPVCLTDWIDVSKIFIPSFTFYFHQEYSFKVFIGTRNFVRVFFSRGFCLFIP